MRTEVAVHRSLVLAAVSRDILLPWLPEYMGWICTQVVVTPIVWGMLLDWLSLHADPGSELMDPDLLALLSNDALASVWLLLASLLIAQPLSQVRNQAAPLAGVFLTPIRDSSEAESLIRRQMLEIIIKHMLPGSISIARSQCLPKGFFFWSHCNVVDFLFHCWRKQKTLASNLCKMCSPAVFI